MRCVAEFSTALTWMKSLRSTGSAIYRCVYEHIPRSVDLDLYCQLQDIYSDSINWLLQRKYTPKLHKAIIFFILHCGFLKIYSMNLAWVFSRTSTNYGRANPINISVSCSQMSCIPLRHRMFETKFAPTISWPASQASEVEGKEKDEQAKRGRIGRSSPSTACHAG